MDDQRKHVVIVGGGFAGVACAKLLADEERVRVTLVDKNGYQQFQPLLYQVATAELNRHDMAFDLHTTFRDNDSVTVRQAEVVAADPVNHSVTLEQGETIAGDVLVVAVGAQPNFFHTPGAEEHGLPLYSLEDALRVRARILELFQDAAAKPDLIEHGALTFVIVGAGATGVETAGALADLVHDVMPHRYQHLAISHAKIIVVDLGHVVLAPFSDDAHTYAAKTLQKRGVQLRLGVSAKEVAADHIVLSDGTSIPTHLVIWAGGEMASPLAARCGLSQGRGGRIDVRPDLSVAGFPGVYVLGDCANIPFGDENALPQLGSVAQQSGNWAARNILGDLDGTGREPFHYRDKGIMAMIGRKAAVAEVGEHRHEMHGRIAFAAWLGVHAELLSNAGAEMKAFLSWAEEFYVRPHHRSAELMDLARLDVPRIDWGSTERGASGDDRGPRG